LATSERTLHRKKKERFFFQWFLYSFPTAITSLQLFIDCGRKKRTIVDLVSDVISRQKRARFLPRRSNSSREWKEVSGTSLTSCDVPLLLVVVVVFQKYKSFAKSDSKFQHLTGTDE